MALTQKQKQQFFNDAYKGVIAQGKIANYPTCQYETKDGLHCGVGHVLAKRGLLPPGVDYDEDGDLHSIGIFAVKKMAMGDEPWIDRREANFLNLQMALQLIGVEDADDYDFMLQLQQAHDGSVNLQDFRDRMGDLAVNHNLAVPKV